MTYKNRNTIIITLNINPLGDNGGNQNKCLVLKISPIFKVADMYKYENEAAVDTAQDQETPDIDWVKQLPTSKDLQPERIMDKKVYKKTRGREYF